MGAMKISLLILVVTACSAEVVPAPAKGGAVPKLLDTRIVGGTDAGINEFPSQVSVQLHGSHFCGGTVLNERTVITAAHCLVGRSTSTVSVVAAEIDLTWEIGYEQEVQASKFVIHAQYNDDTLANDIALIHLASPLKFNSFVAPVRLPRSGADTSAGTLCTVTGWGLTTEMGSSSSILQKVDVPVKSDSTCNALYFDVDILDSMICAGEEGKDSCQGDSGGPLFCGGEQVGIVSWGYGCARPTFPGVYTQMSHFIAWIESNKFVV